MLQWCSEMTGYPDDSKGMIVYGASMATLIGVKTARDKKLEFASGKSGLGSCKLAVLLHCLWQHGEVCDPLYKQEKQTLAKAA